MKFVIQLEKSADAAAFQAAVPDHVRYLNELHDRGILIAGGPFADGEGGMILIDAADEAAAVAVAETDPFIKTGVERYRLRRWEILTPVRPNLLCRDDEPI